MNTAVQVSEVSETASTPAPKRKAGRPEGSGISGQTKALYIQLAGEGKSRPEILVAFEALGLKPGSAAVYYHNAKNAAVAAGFVPPARVKAVATETTVAPEAVAA